MPTPSFLKSPAFLTGSGVVGSGAIGIGGWQIYEENYPPMHKTMNMKGFKLTPIESPNETKTKVTDERVKWNSWGCVDRLFKGVSFQHNDPDTSSSEKISYTPALPNLTLGKEDNPIGCALMQLYPIQDAGKHYFYFRSEFVIKGENVGWVLLVVMANSMEKQSGSDEKQLVAYFLHRLILLQKEGSNWKIKEGYGWTGNVNNAKLANEKAYIKSPKETWFDERPMTDTNFFSKREWSGIWEANRYYGDSILKGVEAYINSPDQAEVLGSDGTFSSSSSVGYKNMSALYKDGTGWVKPQNMFEHEKRLPKWYEPFKDLKGGWSDLESRCQAAANSRHSYVSEDLKDICWQKQSSK